MSKGKYERKRRAKEKALQHSKQVGIIHGEMPTSKGQPESAKNSEAERHEKDERNMRLREIPKHSTVTERLLVAFTFALALLGYFQWKTSESQLDVSRNDERAWLRLTLDVDETNSTQITVLAGKDVALPMRLTNTGKTPAKDIVIKMFVEAPIFSQEPRLECAEKDISCPNNSITSGILFPTERRNFAAVRVSVDGKSRTATETEAKYWPEGGVYLAVYGTITYYDVFTTHHTTKFCFWLGEPGKEYNTQSCTQYNSAN